MDVRHVVLRWRRPLGVAWKEHPCGRGPTLIKIEAAAPRESDDHQFPRGRRPYAHVADVRRAGVWLASECARWEQTSPTRTIAAFLTT